ELPREPPTPSSKSRTNGHLALARCGPNQKQIRNIHAGQHEHEPDKQKEKRSHGLDHGRILRGGVKRTTRKGLEPIPLVDFRILGGEPTSHDGKYRLRLSNLHARLQPDENLDVYHPTVRPEVLWAVKSCCCHSQPTVARCDP